MPMPPSRRDRTIAYALVAAQAGLIAGVLLMPERHDWPLPGAARIAVWIVFGAAGALGLWAAKWLGRGLTALPLPNGRTDLVVRGPYRWVRHPIYTAVMAGTAGVVGSTRSWPAAAVGAGLVVLFGFKARWEERHLAVAFPGYTDYGRRTGRFVPGVGRLPGSSGSSAA